MISFLPCQVLAVVINVRVDGLFNTTELLEKAASLPATINWHFIGALQTNKCKHLAEKVPNLWAVESVDAVKKADALEKGRAALLSTSPSSQKLRVYIQVNTSGPPPWINNTGSGG